MLLTQAVARSKLKMKCRREKVMPKEKYVRVHLCANVNLLLAATLDLNSLSNAKCKRLNFQKEKLYIMLPSFSEMLLCSLNCMKIEGKYTATYSINLLIFKMYS